MVRGSLEGLPSVSRVEFDSQSNTFIIDGAAGLSEQQVRGAVLGRVVLPRFRRFLGYLSGKVRPGTEAPA